LEENHFIHRDIAARNCLLTNKTKAMTANFNHINNFFNITNYSNGFNNSGIIVKIADFGEYSLIYHYIRLIHCDFFSFQVWPGMRSVFSNYSIITNKFQKQLFIATQLDFIKYINKLNVCLFGFFSILGIYTELIIIEKEVRQCCP